MESSFYVGDDPGRLALSDDGKLLYVACNGSTTGSNSVRRFDLPSRTLSQEIFLGRHDYYAHLLYYASDMVPLPGQPRSVAVAKACTFGPLFPTLEIYDDGVKRTNTLGEITQNGPFSVQAASANRLYVGAPFTRVNLDASGVAAFDTHDGLLGYPDTMKLQGGFIFTRGGRVFNPETLDVLGYLPPSYWVEPDLAVGRIFTVANTGSSWTLYTCDPVSLLAVGSLVLNGVSGGPATLIRWGTNGLAFHTFGNQVCLVRTPLVPSGQPADLAVAVAAVPSVVTLTSNLTYTIRITNRGPNAGPDVRLTDRLPTGVNFVSVAASQGSCVLSSGVLTCMLGHLPNGGEAMVTMDVVPVTIVPA